MERFITRKRSERVLPKVLSTVFVFLLCCFAWIFFRASNMQEAAYVINHMFDGCVDIVSYLSNAWIMLNISVPKLLILTFALALLLVFDYISLKWDVIARISEWNVLLRWSIYVSFVLSIVFFRAVNREQAFIYFQF